MSLGDSRQSHHKLDRDEHVGPSLYRTLPDDRGNLLLGRFSFLTLKRGTRGYFSYQTRTNKDTSCKQE